MHMCGITEKHTMFTGLLLAQYQNKFESLQVNKTKTNAYIADVQYDMVNLRFAIYVRNEFHIVAGIKFLLGI